jgi:hypothetical protein
MNRLFIIALLLITQGCSTLKSTGVVFMEAVANTPPTKAVQSEMPQSKPLCYESRHLNNAWVNCY